MKPLITCLLHVLVVVVVLKLTPPPRAEPLYKAPPVVPGQWRKHRPCSQEPRPSIHMDVRQGSRRVSCVA
jgi:hypothetical protein